MAARLPCSLRTAFLARPAISQQTTLQQARRSFQTSQKKLQDVAPVAVRKPVGAFRGTIFGFLLGSTLAGAGLYYYVVNEYKVSNELLTEDIYALQSAVQRLEGYVKTIEGEVKSRK